MATLAPAPHVAPRPSLHVLRATEAYTEHGTQHLFRFVTTFPNEAGELVYVYEVKSHSRTDVRHELHCISRGQNRYHLDCSCEGSQRRNPWCQHRLAFRQYYVPRHAQIEVA